MSICSAAALASGRSTGAAFILLAIGGKVYKHHAAFERKLSSLMGRMRHRPAPAAAGSAGSPGKAARPA